MIPKSLLTTFLSLRITTNSGAPPQAARSVEAPAFAQRVEAYDSVHVPEVQDRKPAPKIQWDVELDEVYSNEQQQALTIPTSKHDVATMGSFVFPFDTIPGGEWNGDEYYQGVRLTNNATSWIWSLPDAFPKIKPYRGMNKAWGPYPEGKAYSIYLEKPAVVSTCAFAYVLNGDFSPGSYEIFFYIGGRLITSEEHGFGAGWVAWRSGTVDRIDIVVTSGGPSGIILLNYLAVED